MEQPLTSRRTYVLVFVALLALTALTAAAALVDLGPWNTVVALGIAAVKASLVALFFMQARRSGPLTWLIIGAGLLWLGLLIVGSLDDPLTRGWLPVPGK